MPIKTNQDFGQKLVAGLNYGVTENQPGYHIPVSRGGFSFFGGGFDNNGAADYALFELVNAYFESLPVNFSTIPVPWDGILNNNIEWEIANFFAVKSGRIPFPIPINLPTTGGGIGGGLIPGQPTTYVGPPCQGDAFTNRSNGFHTFQLKMFNVTANIQILATLDVDPNTTNYVPIFLTDVISGKTTNSLTFSGFPGSEFFNNGTVNRFYTSIGQYSWIKASITNFSSGVVDFIKVAF